MEMENDPSSEKVLMENNITGALVISSGPCISPSDCMLLHPEKKISATITKKKATPAKKLTFARVALVAMEADDHEQGLSQWRNGWKCWAVISDALSKHSLLLCLLVKISAL
jgi:hypothetical protein